MRINFGGHFTLGEKFGSLEAATLLDAARLPGERGVVLGDVGFVRRLQGYLHEGQSFVVEEYRRRFEVSRGYPCVHYLIPSPSDVEGRVDWKVFERARDEGVGKSFEEVQRYVDEKVVPEVIEGLGIENDMLFSQRFFRNKAARSARTVWRKSEFYRTSGFFAGEAVLNEDGAPYSRGIMFELLRVLSENFSTLYFCSRPEEVRAISKAHWMYDFVRESFNLPDLGVHYRVVGSQEHVKEMLQKSRVSYLRTPLEFISDKIS